MILDFQKYAKTFLFVNQDTPEGDIYYCDCGEVITKESNRKELQEEYDKVNKEVIVLTSDDEEVAQEFRDLYKNAKLGIEDEICCSNCGRNFLASTSLEQLITNDANCISGYSLVENETDVTLNYSVIKSDLSSKEKVNFTEIIKYIRLSKEDRKLFYKTYDEEEREFDLDEVSSISDSFFVFDTVKVINIIDMHLFVGRLANFIIDAKNINIINELLESLRGNITNAGLDVIKKITTIFMGIIKYSNLSTIAMTKSPLFLYDLMTECNIPKPAVLAENNVTSPIKIFNFLIQNYIQNLNTEINADNKDVHEFKFKSTKRIDYDSSGENVIVKDLEVAEEKAIVIAGNLDYNANKVKKDKGQYQVEEAISDGSVSKFIFNKIDKFNDYKKIIKFFKHVDKQELILLLQKYEIEFLVEVIDLIYFRNKVSYKELDRILDIILDYTTIESKKYCKFMDGVVRMDYGRVKSFSFINYDDSLMMMEVLKFDPKVDFNKIRTYKELNAYHDNLIKYFSVLKDEEKNGSIMEFVSKFKMLESREDYDGPLEIKLLSTPGMIIKEGVEMKHSASAYARNVAQGFYLMGQVFDRDPNRADNEPPRYTIGFHYDKLAGLEFEQVKGFANELGDGIPKKTDRFKKLMMEWLTIKDISYRPINDLKLNWESNDIDEKL